jgi:hypothetical protein
VISDNYNIKLTDSSITARLMAMHSLCGGFSRNNTLYMYVVVACMLFSPYFLSCVSFFSFAMQHETEGYSSIQTVR